MQNSPDQKGFGHLTRPPANSGPNRPEQGANVPEQQAEQTYSAKELADRFGVSDATIRTRWLRKIEPAASAPLTVGTGPTKRYTAHCLELLQRLQADNPAAPDLADWQTRIKTELAPAIECAIVSGAELAVWQELASADQPSGGAVEAVVGEVLDLVLAAESQAVELGEQAGDALYSLTQGLGDLDTAEDRAIAAAAVQRAHRHHQIETTAYAQARLALGKQRATATVSGAGLRAS